MTLNFKKIIFALGLTFFCASQCFVHPLPISAQENPVPEPTQQPASEQNFDTSLTTIYTVNKNGQTYVEHQFKIKNLSPEYYINKYGLQLNSTSIDNIKIYHQNKELTPEVTKTNKETSIGISLSEKVVGEGKINQLKISYTDPDVAQINGQVLEINIPKLADASKYNQRDVKLITPIYYGYPQRVNLTNYANSLDNQQVITYFANPGGEAISALFGNQQIYQLKADYYLNNNTSNPGLTQIALPPDTPWQKINYQVLEPLPDDFKLDQDGNWIATYKLAPATSMTVKIQALVKVSINQDPNIPVISPGKEHLATAKPWPVDNGQIKDLAKTYNSPKTIYQYSIDTLDYTTKDLSKKIDRLGTMEALNNPTDATCQEFTDLFITLARANNIPARRLTGYAYSNNEKLKPLSLNQDILHAWPEYWDETKKNWISVDPTWEDTTGGIDYFNQFDLNHLVFAINGVDSNLPYPAGAYKEESNHGKTVEVSFAQDFPVMLPKFDLKLEPREQPFSLLPGLYYLTLTNQTGQAWYNLDLDFESEAAILIENSFNIDAFTLLPFQNLQLPVIIYNQNGWKLSDTQLNILLKYNHETKVQQQYQIKTAPKLHHFIYNPVFLASLVIGGLIVTLIAGSILVFRRKK